MQPDSPELLQQSWLYTLGRPLLIVHALSAVVLAGASVHQAVIAGLAVRGRVRARLAKVYAWVTLLAYGVTGGVGLCVYPRYRYFVRALFLDQQAPWAANLFDWKENLAFLGVPFVVGAFVMGRRLTDRTQRAVAMRLYLLFATGTALIVVSNLVSGLLVTSVRGY